MIIGVGVDILDYRRIERLCNKFGDKFIKKIFTDQEIEFCNKRKRVVESLAKMFAIKESVIKAISDVSGVFWHDIQILHDENGKPFVELSGAALLKAKAKSKQGEFNLQVSVSDELPYITAFSVLES